MSCYETKDTEKQDHQAFKKAPAQIGDLPSGIRMKDDKGEIFVPKIMILPFKRLQYKTFVKKVLIANGELGDRGCRRLRQLWKSLINELYFYVAEKDRKTQISKVNCDLFQRLASVCHQLTVFSSLRNWTATATTPWSPRSVKLWVRWADLRPRDQEAMVLSSWLHLHHKHQDPVKLPLEEANPAAERSCPACLSPASHRINVERPTMKPHLQTTIPQQMTLRISRKRNP